MLIQGAKVHEKSLANTTVLLTGGGGGIGYEAAKALAWMGANVVIAEVDRQKGQAAERQINELLKSNRVLFYPIDLADQQQIEALHSFLKSRYGFVDVIFNNATITPLGAIGDVSIADWDRSYAVNLRAPVLLTQAFLPDMLKENRGTIIFVPSSGLAPYMGAYEVFKTAQVELCNTLAGELASTNIRVFSIGPGLVKTDTAMRGIEKVSALMGLCTDEFYALNQRHMLDAEHAGTGFALSVLFAQRYNGQEVSSIQALIDAGVMDRPQDDAANAPPPEMTPGLDLEGRIASVVQTYDEQYDGWMRRNVFERQWVLRDFKKEVNRSADQFQAELKRTLEMIRQGDLASLRNEKALFAQLQKYYRHQHKLMLGYERDAKKREENSRILLGWVEELQGILDAL